jgi:hypothetical protein
MLSQRQVAAFIGVALLSALAPRGARAGGFALGAEAGYYDMTSAADSAKAVFDGKSGGVAFGALARVDVGRSFFAGVGARMFRKEGQRAFVAGPGEPSFPLGHPLKVRVLPVYGLFGYRLRPEAALVPYAGVGVGLTSYHEESTVAGLVTKSSTSKVSGHAVAGLEYGRGRLRFALEAMYMTAPDSIGLDGVSSVYGEDDVGGVSAVGRIVFVP